MNTAEAIEHCAEAFADSLGADFSALDDSEKKDFLDGASVVIAAHLGWLAQNGFNVLPPGAIPAPRSKGEATAMFNAGKAFLNDKNALLMSGPRAGLVIN